MRDMSKTAKLVLILLVVTVASFIIAGIMFFAEYGGGNSASLANVLRPSNAIDVDEEKTQSIAGVEDIYVNTTSDNIHIIKSDSDELKVHFYGYYSTSDKNFKPELAVTLSGSEIRIKVSYNSMSVMFFNSNLKLDVYLPAAYSKNLDVETTSADIGIDEISPLGSLVCKSSSGGINASSANAQNASFSASSGDLGIGGAFGSLDCSASSGNISSEGLKAKTAAFGTTSGDIRVNATADDLDLHSSSGSISALQVAAKNCKAQTTSGTIDLRGDPGKLEAASSSGDVKLEYAELNSDISVKTTSGSVRIKLPSNAEFRLKHTTSSGESNVGFPITVSGDRSGNGIEGTVVSDRNIINVSTSSGSLNIDKK